MVEWLLHVARAAVSTTVLETAVTALAPSIAEDLLGHMTADEKAFVTPQWISGKMTTILQAVLCAGESAGAGDMDADDIPPTAMTDTTFSDFKCVVVVLGRAFGLPAMTAAVEHMQRYYLYLTRDTGNEVLDQQIAAVLAVPVNFASADAECGGGVDAIADRLGLPMLQTATRIVRLG